ncbi:MAG TPA: HD domain-containing protein [Candidatus Nanoarchaeia archaeon]|nr:HD domain-containing protein [Candidatus Nanoarchaeia archaeon]
MGNNPSMGKEMTPERAIALLLKYATADEAITIILAHSRRVAEIALRYARRIPGIDLNFIECAALLHDIGRFQCPPGSLQSIQHGMIGAEILRQEGMEERYALICERHIGAGITVEDIQQQRLDLPLRNFSPRTREEKIIAHADNIGKAERELTVSEAVARFTKELGPEYGQRIAQLAKEVEALVPHG